MILPAARHMAAGDLLEPNEGSEAAARSVGGVRIPFMYYSPSSRDEVHADDETVKTVSTVAGFAGATGPTDSLEF